MAQLNNHSVIPWYDSIEQQDARKWWVYGKVYPLYCPNDKIIPFQIKIPTSTAFALSLCTFDIYSADGTFIRRITPTQALGFYVVSFTTYQVVVCTGMDLSTVLPIGRYYFRFGIAVSASEIYVRYSDIVTVVDDLTPYIVLKWRDSADFELNDGDTIVYVPSTGVTFWNEMYVPADVAKPTYDFEEEADERDGYSFVTKQISSKVYHFSFLAPEYLLDCMRLIRMSDYITIDGQSVDSFLMTPEWQDYGDIASVDVEFKTNTVAKKVGRLNINV